MKIAEVLAFSIVALCLIESYVSAQPVSPVPPLLNKLLKAKKKVLNKVHPKLEDIERQLLARPAIGKLKADLGEVEHTERRKLADPGPPFYGKLKADLSEVEHMERRKLAARIKPEADLKEVEHIETQMDSQLPVPANIDKALDPCRGKWTEFEESCYHVDDTIKSWSQAQAYCRGLKANLVKINSLKENEFVLDLVRKHAPKVNQVWMGLQWVDGADPKSFYWFDDSVPTFRNWAPGEPNNSAKGYCVQMYVGGHHNELATHASGYWNDNLCDHPDEPSAIVCKRLF